MVGLSGNDLRRNIFGEIDDELINGVLVFVLSPSSALFVKNGVKGRSYR